MWLQNTGILEKLFKSVLDPPPFEPLSKLRINEPLNLNQVGTAAMVMAFGMIVSLILFLGELGCGNPETIVMEKKSLEKKVKKRQRWDGTIRQ